METGLVAADRAYPGALFDAVGAFLDDAVLEHPGLVAGGLKINVAAVDRMPEQLAEHPIERLLVESGGRQQAFTGNIEIRG
jgi:hypothetical protein